MKYNRFPCLTLFAIIMLYRNIKIGKKMHLFIKFYRAITLSCIAVMMIACTSIPKDLTPESQQNAWKTHQQSLSHLTAFQANGSLSYVSGSTKYYGRFFINQATDNEYQLKLTTPVGTSMFSLTVTPYLAELTDKDGKKYIDENVDRLMAKLTGMNIPFKSLHNWFKGYSDNPQNDMLDSQGRLFKTTLSQSNQNWLLTIAKYETYRANNNSLDLPSSIELSNKNDKLKVTINHWKID